MMTIEEIKSKGLVLFECISGSRAYGLATPTSDTDIRGVFVLPKELYYSMDYIGQINNETNDEVYYELKKFMELCAKNNPNILELLNTPKDCVLYKDRLFDKIKLEYFLSKLSMATFSNYAFTQIKKARGLNKKIVNPMGKERKSVEDFCFVRDGKKAIPFKDFVKMYELSENNFGVTSLSNIKDCYNLFYKDKLYLGIAKAGANELRLSSISKEEEPIALLYFNRDGYSSYCKRYKEYWDWVDKRNEERYKTNVTHSKNYDSKNIMHTFRLLYMAEEIAKHQNLSVRFSEKTRTYLLSIKRGDFEYDNLISEAEKIKKELEILFEKSGLIERPDIGLVNKLLLEIRDEFYKRN